MFQFQAVSKQIKSRNYTKVPYALKRQLLEYVFKQGLLVKNAAQILKINYAAAKTIICKAKKCKLEANPNSKIQGKPCGIKKITNKTHFTIHSILQGALVQIQEFQ